MKYMRSGKPMPTDSADTAEGEHEHKGVSSLLTVNADHDPEDLKIIAKLILGLPYCARLLAC